MVVVLAASVGGDAKDHHVTRTPPPTDAFSSMESLKEILHHKSRKQPHSARGDFVN
jgi:hypothetical protein